MQKKTAEYIIEVRKALKNAGKYNKSLELQIFSLAGSLRALDLAIGDIDDLESTSYDTTNRYGSESKDPHPAFRILKESQDAVTRQMKALGLTAADLDGGDDNDPLIELTKKVRSSGQRKQVVIKPDET